MPKEEKITIRVKRAAIFINQICSEIHPDTTDTTEYPTTFHYRKKKTTFKSVIQYKLEMKTNDDFLLEKFPSPVASLFSRKFCNPNGH